MTLSFTQTINGKPNYFIEKIWSGIPLDDKYTQNCLFMSYHINKFGTRWDETQMGFNYGYKPKIHTIRLDPHNRWRAGMKIHPVINNRTPQRFQFAPALECKCVQEIDIYVSGSDFERANLVVIDGKDFYDGCGVDRGMLKLAINDGFDSVDDFFAYFNKDFTGKLIHWTDLKY